MEKLKRLIGFAPSEFSWEELLRKIRTRQELVAGVLQEFRNRLESGGASEKTGKTKAKAKASPRAKGEAKSLAELLAGMKELGITMEDLKKVKVS